METPDWIKEVWNDEHPSPCHEIVCRHCHARNRVLVSRAVIAPEKYSCAKCEKPLFLSKDESLTDLSSRSFEHTQDASTLRSLHGIPGASALLRTLFKHFNERAYLYNLTANAVKCGEDQFPELVAIVKSANDRLGTPLTPTVFFSSTPFSNAYTSGGERAILCFSTALLNQMNDEELKFVTGHELGHLMSEHAIAKLLLKILLSGSLSILPNAAKYVSVPLRMSLLKWSRCSELTADRAGLLACRDLTTALNAMLKMVAGHDPGINQRTQLSLAALIRQAKDLKSRDQENLLDSVVASFFVQNQTHPLVAWRILELLDWVENGNYLDIISGEYF